MSTERELAATDSQDDAAGPDRDLPQLFAERTDCTNAGEFWQSVQRCIKDRLGQERFGLWFRQTELMKAEPEQLVVGVPNIIIQQYLSARYTDVVAEAVRELLGVSVPVAFDIAPRLFRQMRERRERQADGQQGQRDQEKVVDLQQVRRASRLPASWGFEHLVATESNCVPFAAARELAGQENPRFHLLYISGDYGTGKTELLRAICALADGSGRGLEPTLVSVEDWCNSYYRAIQRKTTHAFRSRYRSCNMLLLDDVQFVQGKPGGQRELLHSVKHILSQGGRVALTGRHAPAELEEITPALLAMLEGAFRAELRPPNAEECPGVARALGGRHGLEAVSEVYELVAEQFGSSMALLESAVCRLSFYGSVHGLGVMDVPDAREALEPLSRADCEPLSRERVVQVVVEAFPVSAEQVRSRSRRRNVSRARQVCIYLLRNFTGASLSEIGAQFGGMAHSSVKYAVDKVAERRRQEEDFDGIVSRLEERLGR